jgi:hypothetical protein
MKARLLLALAAAVLMALVVWRAGKQTQRATAAHGSQDTAPAVEGRSMATTTTLNAISAMSSASGSNSLQSMGAVTFIAPTTTKAANHMQPATSASVAEEPSAAAAAILLENLRTTVRHYGLRFGGNPVGTNQEITKALNGGNPKHVEFLGPDGNRINDKGELVDPWGTPYFFHQLSGQVMEIRSAGPDKRMWTDDDLIIR